ncbi:unnamed protein product [Heligmosomoides polygyrus]|uniref:ARF7EP_C domain-containing protein n=1 Tax=Heligmosomoides polygyrus TaxID=6339 RepID=A0A3P8B5T8_HELPZ|nr:unnamed protein product [Heligmosomoides polygyrus]
MSSTNDALSYLVGLANARADRQRQIQRALGKLQFINPGGLMMTQPTSNRRSRRKIIARAVVAEDKEQVHEKRQVFHDKKGKLVVPGEESITLCDCLIPECHGCHWPLSDEASAAVACSTVLYRSAKGCQTRNKREFRPRLFRQPYTGYLDACRKGLFVLRDSSDWSDSAGARV